MQPLISIENVENLVNEIMNDIPSWRKEMIHYIKDENPELNTAIIELSQKTGLDPKALATGAYMAYKLLENEAKEQGELENALFDEE
ncbi:MAG: hypothetical protein IJW73_01805 [Candidatus Gastranaerophilales bacterium]|nr:hypothetical protein [Candidatus Gastranaerophilales bacterium]